MGIGGGGDVVGALAAAALLGNAIVGGITWERRPVDPIPGPRTLRIVLLDVGGDVLARGERGATVIRQGRRTVLLTELGGVVAWFDPLRAIDTAARLAAAVRDAASLAEADAILEARGIRTELAYERAMAQA